MRRLLLVVVVVVATALAVVAALVVVDRSSDRPGPAAPTPSPALPSRSSAPAEPPAPQPTASAPTISPCTRPSPVQLTVLTMNLHFARTQGGRLDLDRVAEELTSWRPDVVLLQEVDRGRFRTRQVDQAVRLGRRLGMEVVHGLNPRVQPGSSGNAILSRYPVVSAHNEPLPWRRGELRRGLVRATIDVDGHRIDVFDTHLEHTSPSARARQSRAVVGQVLRSRRPVVLGGDLNAGPEGPPLRRIRRAGLVDAWASAGHGAGLTVPARAPRRRIDFLFTDETFRPVASEVLRSLVSDHRSVRTELALLPASCR